MKLHPTLVRRLLVHLALGLSIAVVFPSGIAVAQDCNQNGVPDAQDVDPTDPDGDGMVFENCNGNQFLDVCELVANDCNANGILDDCELGIASVEAIWASDGGNIDGFGVSIDRDGDYAVIGAPFNDEVGINAGAAYVFQEVGGAWVEITKLTNPSASAGDWFGYHVEISGGTIVVGAPLESVNGEDDVGAVYCFTLIADSWQLTQRIEGESAGEEFGYDLELNGDELLVSAPRASTFGSWPNHAAGVVRVFERDESNSWSLIQQLQSSRDLIFHSFGGSISLDGATLAIGTIYSRVPEGSFYILGNPFEKLIHIYEKLEGQWVETGTLSTTAGRESRAFGTSVVLDGDTIAVGDPEFNIATGMGSTREGRVHIFERAGAYWFETAALTSANATPSGYFGFSLALEDEVVLVGPSAFFSFTGVKNSVSVLRKRDGDWYQQSIPFTSGYSSSDGNFGISLRLDSGNAMIGAPRTRRSSFQSSLRVGGVFNVDVTDRPGDLNENLNPDNCDIANCPDGDLTCADCNQNGVPDGVEPDCDGDGIIDTCVIAACANGDLSCGDCNANDIPDGCELIDNDCNGNGVPDDCDLAGNDPLGLTWIDCNANGIIDACESNGGLWPDCDGNGTADPCDVRDCPAGDLSCADCNGNDIPDGCEMLVSDCNENGILDECEVPGLTQRLNNIGDGIDLDLGTWWDSLYIDGDTMLIGKQHGDNNPGALYAFEKLDGRWQYQQLLQIPDEATDSLSQNGFFYDPSFAISVDGDTAVIGAPFVNTYGAAYVLRRFDGVWRAHKRLVACTPTSTQPNDLFGYKVQIKNETIVVAAPDYANQDRGSVYIFEPDGLGNYECYRFQQLELNPSTYWFASSIYFDGDTLFVSGGNFGLSWESNFLRVYMYRRVNGEWLAVGFIDAPRVSNFDWFGRQIASSNGTVAISSIALANSGPLEGVVSIYEEVDGQYELRTMLTPNGPGEYEEFGEVMAMSGSTIVVGATQSGRGPDRLFVFRKLHERWQQAAILAADDYGVGDFGLALDVEGMSVVVNAVQYDGNNEIVVPLAIDVSGTDCNLNGIPDACELADGAEDCNDNQVIDTCEFSMCLDGYPGCKDCDGNGVLDECDGWEDCNGNGVPDVCDLAPASAQQRISSVQDLNLYRDGSAIALKDGHLFVRSSSRVSVHVLDGLEWRLEQLLSPALTGSNDYGSYLDVDQGRLVVGDKGARINNQSFAGNVLIFERVNGQWTVTQELTAPVPTASDYFGSSVDILGDTILVSAPYDDAAGVNRGAVYLFKLEDGEWNLSETFLPHNDLPESALGSAIVLGSDQIFIGAQGYASEQDATGRVYAYERSGEDWIFGSYIMPNEPEAQSGFGAALALDGDTLVVGAPLKDGVDSSAGAAYLFEANGNSWTEHFVFTPSFDSLAREFGNTLCINGDRIAIGMPVSSEPKVSVYKRTDDTWSLEALVDDESIDFLQGVGWSRFGCTLAIEGGRLLVGADQFDQSQGAVFEILLEGTSRDCNGDGIPDECSTSSEFTDFVQALLTDADSANELCRFDLDRDGQIDGRDLTLLVARLIEP